MWQQIEGLPAGIEARPIEKADAEAWAALLAEVEQTDDTGENYDAEHLVELLADERMQPELYSAGLWSGERMVGACFVRDTAGQRAEHRMDAAGTVHPRFRRRGLGRLLIDWAGATAVRMHAERGGDLLGELGIGAHERNTGLITLLEHAGFERCRYFSDMGRDLTDLPGRPAPGGLRLVAFDSGYDEATRVAHNEAFLDHWGFDPRERQFWQTHVTGSRAFRPAVSHLLVTDDPEPVVAAYALCYEFPADTAVTGLRDLYFGQIGTRRAFRGRGAAGAVIAASLRAGADLGFQRASLGVDADSPTGAVGLYEKLGFTVTQRWIAFRRPL
jgi:mycothiol synthase